MKRFLPKSVNNPQGFTLIELMIVITIIAILSVIGVVVFSGVQRNARDARRRGDIDAIFKALEVNKTTNSQVYNLLNGNQFANGAIPQDSINGSATYCVLTSIIVGAPPALPLTWVNTSACPTASWNTISNTNPAATTASWTICALLENGANPANIYCKQSVQ